MIAWALWVVLCWAQNVTYIAKFPGSGPNVQISGNVTFRKSASDEVQVTVSLDNLPDLEKDQSMTYHVHEKKISDRNCSSTGGHLNPDNKKVPCDQTNLAECEAGDLAGKYGPIDKVPAYTKAYSDKYISLEQAQQNSILDRSVVIHAPDGARIACADIVRLNETSTKAIASQARVPLLFIGLGLILAISV